MKVTERHTAIDYAYVLKEISDDYFPEGDLITLLQDNLNIPPSRLSTKPSQRRKLAASFSASSGCTPPSMGRGSIWPSRNWRSSPANALIAAFQINKPSNARSPPGSNTATSTTPRPTGASQPRPLASAQAPIPRDLDELAH